MSGESFSVDTDGLQAQMPYMQELAQRFRNVHEALEARLGALGECWGDDASGEAFLRQYTKPKGQILEATEDAGDVLRSTGDGLQTMARGYQNIESQNSESARKLGTSLEPGSVPGGGVRGGQGGGEGGDGSHKGSGRP
ncbi:WXG100 family type VII secretion target [Streptomyces sp. NBC_00448]|uniref:WXG100 family type VII secretion target n=1 Tax=Streptomyces sp. NBC_00448 TaxID=2903652 RepID=UPI002E23F3F8